LKVNSKVTVGVDVRLLSMPPTGIGRYTFEMCRRLNQASNISLCLYSPASMLDQYLPYLDRAIIRTKNLKSKFLRQLWGESYLRTQIMQDNIDVFWGPAHRLPRWLPKNIARVVTIHDLVWKYAGDTMPPISRWLESYQMPFAISSADQIITVSQSTADAVTKEFYTTSDKLSVVPLGANLAAEAGLFDSLEQFGINRPYFLFVGTLEPRKNLIRLLTAYSRLSESLKDQAMLVIAGGKGWGGIEINDTVADLSLEKHVRILGYVDDSTLATLYANALFLAMPSLYEGFGLPLVEAMSFGTPVLTSNNSSMPEVAGNAGLLINPLDIQSINDGLAQLISNHDLRDKLADNAKINAARFNWDAAAKQLVSVFEKAISTRNKQHP